MTRRDDIGRIGEQARYVAADPGHPFYGREDLAVRVGLLQHFGPLSDADLAAVEWEWRRLHPPSRTSWSDDELAAMLDMLDRYDPPPPLAPDDELAGLMAMLAADPDPLPLLTDDADLAALLAQLDADEADRGRW